ncbi:MAG TPA: CopG family transcriptional regulator [Myxococcota bacterium]|nr:CopG family transcriptional regulator [Myxococcota bacterium]
MRTTLTLDEDVAKRIERLRERQDLTLREVVNQALRHGLSQLEMPQGARKRHTTKAVSLGGCLIGHIDDIAEVLAVAEGDSLR